MFGLIYIWVGLHEVTKFGIIMEKLIMNMVVLANLVYTKPQDEKIWVDWVVSQFESFEHS